MEINDPEEKLRQLWSMYGSSLEDKVDNKLELSDKQLIEEFFFVLLGGFGISYELNKSGFEVLKDKGFIDPTLYQSTCKVQEIAFLLREEFNIKQFEPKTKTMEFRRYRFIESKPFIVANGCKWLWDECNWNLRERLSKFRGVEARDWLCCCPGFGMKSASWFLRNIGFNDDCAVFDVHILRFMTKIGLEVPKTLTEKSYLKLESLLRSICHQIGVSLGEMDYLLWVLGRNGYLSYVR